MTEISQTALPHIDRLQRQALIVGIGALVLSAIGAVFSPAQFFQSYLFAYAFWIGIALGSMVIVFIHYLSGGGWGAVTRRFLESSTRTFLFLALLFLPILFGMHDLYEWTHPDKVAADQVLKHKSLYLNVPFFIGRAVLYFGIWIGLSFWLNKWSSREDEAGGQPVSERLSFIGGIGLLLYGLTMSFASVDWLMSLEPHWFSTMYGLLVIAGQVLSAFAFVIAIAAILVQYKPFSGVISPTHFKDLGNFVLAFVMIWAYLAFSQYLIIWAGNLPEEIPWYLHRLHKGWQYMAILLVVFHFALPFLLLLSRNFKRNPRALVVVAIGILVMRLVDLFWMVAPEFHPNGLNVHYLDFLLPIGLGGIWLALFLWQLKKRPLLPMNDPNLPEAEHGNA
jgi:hypothetical protein